MGPLTWVVHLQRAEAEFDLVSAAAVQIEVQLWLVRKGLGKLVQALIEWTAGELLRSQATWIDLLTIGCAAPHLERRGIVAAQIY